MSDLLDHEMDAAADRASKELLRNEEEHHRIVEYVDGLLAQLPAAERILIVMREVEGLSMEELAVVLGISVGAVKLRLFRARNRLYEIWRPGATRQERRPIDTELVAQQA